MIQAGPLHIKGEIDIWLREWNIFVFLMAGHLEENTGPFKFLTRENISDFRGF